MKKLVVDLLRGTILLKNKLRVLGQKILTALFFLTVCFGGIYSLRYAKSTSVSYPVEQVVVK
jgi:hypothetical protein